MSRLSVGEGVGVSGLVPGDPAGDRLVDQLSRRIGSCEDDVIILRYPSRLVALADRVAPENRRVLPAGGLLYWEVRADTYVAAARASGVEIERFRGGSLSASSKKTRALAMLRDSFDGYVNHYAANGLFEPTVVADGYLEWAQNTLLDPSGIAYILTVDGAVVGAATVSEDPELDVHEIELAAIGAEYQRRGLYRHLLDGIVAGARADGVDRVVISTQSHNTNVQRAWARAGLVPALAVETAHLVRR
ncbi:GNAT family N-acetyltransferase [Mycetocola sp. JXN-3]|uniref:GNAT family N-acetyltransferase n=1 Tax=Mycetocola sp. JXN-3 TaxID=2116510 RepID=UPI00165D05B4|nr:GNAT family N-acetyltransferase [Mycetocola sp. JXN-3]